MLTKALAEASASRHLHLTRPRAPIFTYLLLKLAARCNLQCTYCYWFRDASVYQKPKVLTPDAERALLEKLERHIRRYEVSQFSVLFHGGEPLLFGKRRFSALLQALAAIEHRTGCAMPLSVTTNGVLIDDEWASLLGSFRVRPTVSIDGPASIHDRSRVDRRGGGTHARVLAGLDALRSSGVEPRVLAVCDPRSEPSAVMKHIVEDLGIRSFDVLMPDANHDDDPLSIASYYKKLFDLWYDEYADRGVSVRHPKAFLIGLLGGHAQFEPIGYGPVQVCVVLTDGALEPLDVLRIGGYRTTATELNVIEHDLQELTTDPTWSAAFEASLNLCKTCEECQYRQACGGGFLPHRFSAARGYDNPSVYCQDLKAIFGHISARVGADRPP